MRHHFVRSSAGLRDPNFKNVTLLLHGDGTNGAQNNTFLDSSGSNNAITRTGNVVQGSFSPYGDRWSNYFDGNGDYLSIANNSAFDFGTGDFTIECWFYVFGNSSLNAISNRLAALCTALPTGGATTTGYELVVLGNSTTTGTGLEFKSSVSGTSYSIVYNGTISQATWHHIAVVRSGTLTSIYFNGTSVASGTLGNQNVSNSTHPLFVGASRYATYLHYLNGYTSNLRILKGTAQYTAAFTPPTAPLTAITNTSVLTCQSNRFRDASTNNFAITRNGDVSVQRFSPFSPDTLYRTDRIGGSAYFDGSSDWLFVANRALKLTAGFFTAECWVYLDSFPGNDFFGYTIFSDYYWTGGNTGGYFVNIGSNQKVNLYASSGVFGQQAVAILSSNNSIVLKQWNHIAIVRGGGNLINIYINGVSTTTPVARTSLSLLSGGAANLESRIGVRLHDVWYGPPGDAYGPFIGTISDLRVINGKCLYTANFTPPTEPLTAIPETTFLGRFTNGSIVDNAMMANLETVGNAQISTTVKKYGTGALYFDGTGDYLSAPFDNGRVFGTGDFTIEYWINPISNASGCMVDLRSTELGAGGVAYSDYFAAGGKLGIYISGNTYVSTSTVPTGQWTHIAVSRSGTALRVFFNGIQDGSTVANSQNLVGGPLKVGINVALAGPLNGYLDDLRITKGAARYTSNFTPPTAPFPDF